MFSIFVFEWLCILLVEKFMMFWDLLHRPYVFIKNKKVNVSLS